MTDIFQSPGDRLRFEILLKSLTEGSINLAVLSEHDMVLDYYGNLFEERLRAKGNHQVEFCFSTNSERLVQKFNEILSELTLNQALEKDKKHAPRRFLIFRDSILMQDFELQLLARLVNGFPAGNINVILLINSADAYKNKLEAFGKNLLQWEVETQAGEAKKPLTDWVAESPKDAPAQIEPTLNPFLSPAASDEAEQPDVEPLKLPTKTSWRVPGFGPFDKVPPVLEPLPPAPSALSLAAESGQSAATFLAGATALSAPSVNDVSREPALHASDSLVASSSAADVEVFKRPAKSPWGWLVLVFLLSLAAFGLMYQDLVMQEVEAFKKYLLKGTPAAVVSAQDAELAASAASAAALASALEAASASAEVASIAASEAVVVVSAPASAPVAGPVSAAASAAASAVSVVAPVAAVAPSPVAAVVSSPAKVTEKLEPKVVEKTPSKEPVAGPDDAWVNQLPVNGYVVQLAAFDTEADITAFKRSNAAYAKARVIRAPKKDTDKRYFILLAGPFTTKAQADAFMQTNPLLSKGWLRSVKALKSQFNKP